MRRILFASLRHPLAVLGLALTTASGLLFLVLFFLDVLGQITNHYVGLVSYVALPALFVAGLVAIAVGARFGRVGPEPPWPRIDLNRLRQRQVLTLLLVATLANVVVLSMATYGGVTYMETDQFCGQVCHTAMGPQFTAHRDGPHAEIDCVACHIAPGAGSFIGAKLSGSLRLLAVATGRYERPIRQPRGQGSSTRETCERCHWSDLPHGDRPTVFSEFGNDEANTELSTALRLHVGGGGVRLAGSLGSHWHADPANVVEYIEADGGTDEIPYVRYTPPDGQVREYRVDGFESGDLEAGVTRRMDCLDCHSRPAHAFAASPERAVDTALARGRLDRDLPFVRREAVRALTGAYEASGQAIAEIEAVMTGFYGAEYPTLSQQRPGAVGEAVEVVQGLFGRNRFPELGIDWGAYRSQIGHTDAPGCFRCHDDLHMADDGATIGQDCEMCHGFE